MSSQPAAKQTVMVVDDSDDVREMVATLLRLSGYEVVEARDGREAVELARLGCPALILMDIQMPVMDGLSAARTIRQIERLCGIVILAFSASGPDYRERAMAAGCDGYVSKSRGVGQLPKIVGQYLSAA